MTSYKIIYRKTGSGEIDILDYCVIHTCDELNSGKRINDIMGVITRFEKLAINWGTYENRNAIKEIKII